MMYADAPILNPGEDLLGRTVFASKIADSILEWKSLDSLCVAINGSWGSGKTSLINLIQNSLQHEDGDRRALVFRFEPWLISNHEQLVSVFLTSLGGYLKKRDFPEAARRAAKAIDAFSRLLSVAQFLPLPHITAAAGLMGKVTKGVASTLGGLAELKTNDLSSLKAEIGTSLLQLKNRLVIVIDDIDRLSTKEIVEIVRLVRAVADFPNTVYVLAFDRTIVEAAVKDFQKGSHVSYLDKLFQVSFDIPEAIQMQASQIVEHDLLPMATAAKLAGGEFDRWGELRFGVLPNLFSNIRDAKRYLNSVLFMRSFFASEINLIDIFLMEAVRVFCPDLFHAIPQWREALVSDAVREALGRRTDTEEALKKWLQSQFEAIHGSRVDAIRRALILLFPDVEQALMNRGYASSFYQEWKRERRLCIRPFFQHYFEGVLPSGTVSQRSVDELVAAAVSGDDLKNKMNAFVVPLEINEALEHLVYYFTTSVSVDEEQVQRTLACSCEACEAIPSGEKTSFDIPVHWLITGCHLDLLKCLPKGRRHAVLANIVATAETATAFPVDLAARCVHEWSDPKIPEAERTIDEVGVALVRDSALALLKKRAETLALFQTHEPYIALLHWEELAGHEAVTTWLADSVLPSDENVPRVLRAFGQSGSSTVMGSSYSVKRFWIPHEAVKKFLDVDPLVARCKSILESNPAWLDEGARATLELFLQDGKNLEQRE